MEQPTRTDGQIDPVPVPPGIETDTSLFKELGEVSTSYYCVGLIKE